MNSGWAYGLGDARFEEGHDHPGGGGRSATFPHYTSVSTGEVTAVPQLLHIDTPTDANPEGFKGAGESGTIPVPAAISAAIEDAIRRGKPDAVVAPLPMSPDRVHELLA